VRKKGEKTSQEYLISLNNSLAQSAAVNPEEEKPLELVADEQEFDQNRQIITARGNVTLRFAQSVLTADRLQVNLPEKLAVAEGQVILTRGIKSCAAIALSIISSRIAVWYLMLMGRFFNPAPLGI
jgi:lipopolysaccharide assembly outer membrane protein LptD (OstA)